MNRKYSNRNYGRPIHGSETMNDIHEEIYQLGYAQGYDAGTEDNNYDDDFRDFEHNYNHNNQDREYYDDQERGYYDSYEDDWDADAFDEQHPRDSKGRFITRRGSYEDRPYDRTYDDRYYPRGNSQSTSHSLNSRRNMGAGRNQSEIEKKNKNADYSARGFASMSKAQRTRIARMGGIASGRFRTGFGSRSAR